MRLPLLGSRPRQENDTPVCARPKTIALLLNNLELGGAERQAVELARQLAARGRFRPVVLAMETEGPLRKPLDEAGIPVWNLGGGLSRGMRHPLFTADLLKTILAIAHACRREQAAILQSFLFWENCLAIPAAAITPGVRATVLGRRNTGEYKDERPIYQWVENALNPFTSAIVCNSEDVRHDLRQRERLIRSPVLVIPNGVDVVRFAEGRAADLRTEHPQLRDASLIIGTVGNLKGAKRHDLLLRAIAQARRQEPGIAAIIAGRDMGELRVLERLRSELHLDDAVIFAGKVDDPAPLLRALDCFVLSSDYEGMPNALMEAMAAGLPCAATIDGARGIIKHGQSGLLSPTGDGEALADSLLRLAKDRELREKLGQRAQQTMQRHYSRERMAERYEKLYDRLLQRRKHQ